MHFEQGRDFRRAVRYLQQAGERALQRSAYVEAVAHLTKGLEVLQTLPHTPEHTRQELTLRLALFDALFVARGYTAPDVEKTVLRVRELHQQVGETPQLFPVLFRLYVFYINRREIQTARALSEQLMRLAQGVQDRYLLSVAHMTRGCTLFSLGELTSARPHLEQVIVLYDPQQHPRHTVGVADPRVNCLSYVSWTLWQLGYPDQALQRSQEVVALAEELSHPWSVAFALGWTAVSHLLRREDKRARERAEAVIALCTKQGFPLYLAWGLIVRGWALAEQGQVEEGIAQMQQGLTAYQAMGVELARLTWLALLAEAYGKAGQIEEGLTVLAEALDIVDNSGERVYEAELYRLKGELLLAQAREQATGNGQQGRVPDP